MSEAVPDRVEWQLATVVSATPENHRAVTLRLRPERRLGHLPGQHVVVRLSAPDGYQAQRSYSIASAPEEGPEFELTVERLDDGEVSPYLTEELRAGDQVELRGPIGGWFAWRGEAPLTLIGGGSGVVPLMAMLRERRARHPDVPARMLVSVRSATDRFYAGELGEETTVTITRDAPGDWDGATGRVSAEILGRVAFDAGPIFLCGGNPFVEHVTELLAAAGHDPARVKVERFGPSG